MPEPLGEPFGEETLTELRRVAERWAARDYNTAVSQVEIGMTVLALLDDHERRGEALRAIAEKDPLLEANEVAFGFAAARRMQEQARWGLREVTTDER